ncbi:MAG: hypothetical protein L0H53_12800, partial [Candidatus Nitrosocosmicus sp.]|nr:hypothetical protein [Candidatus Nitrosocosmicus sp.]
MKSNIIVLFVEGPKDVDFINNIIKKFVSNKNKNIQIHPYRYKHVDSRTVNKFIKTYNENQTKYFFLHDQDSNNNCVLKLESE